MTNHQANNDKKTGEFKWTRKKLGWTLSRRASFESSWVWLFWHVKIGIPSASLAKLRLAVDKSVLGKRQEVFVDAGEASSQPEHLATAIFEQRQQ
jgi:hypothetical protein